MSKMLQYLYTRPWMMRRDMAEIAENFLMEHGDIKAVERTKGQAVERSEAGMTIRGRTAVIPIVGPIFRYADWFTEMCGGVTVETLARDFGKAMDDPSIDSILLAVDSGGGEAAGIGEFAAMVRDGTEKKPVVAYVSDMAASAGYYIASAASSIAVAPMATLGSIGVVSMYPRKQESKTRAEIVSSQSPKKRVDVDTDEGRKVIQTLVDDLADIFISDVAKYRGVTAEHVISEFGGGSMLVGAKAVEAGMADRLGSFEGVLEGLAADRQRRQASTVVVPATTSGVPAMAGENTGAAGADTGASKPTGSDGRQQPTTEHIPAPPAMTAEEAAELRREMAAIKATQAADRDARIQAEANTYVTKYRNKIPPAEQPAARKAYVQAARDDLASPLAEGSRTANLEDQAKARPVVPILDAYGSGIGYLPDGAQILNQGGDGPTEAETGAIAPGEFRPQNGNVHIPARKSLADLIKMDPDLIEADRKMKAGGGAK